MEIGVPGSRNHSICGGSDLILTNRETNREMRVLCVRGFLFFLFFCLFFARTSHGVRGQCPRKGKAGPDRRRFLSFFLLLRFRSLVLFVFSSLLFPFNNDSLFQ